MNEHTTNTMSTSYTLFASDATDRLLDEVASARRTSGTVMQSSIGRVPSSGALIDGHLDELHVRLAHADALYPGIASPLERDVLAEIRARVFDLETDLRDAQSDATHSAGLAERRLQGAIGLVDRVLSTEAKAARADVLEVSDLRLRAYVAELEPTLGRVSPRAPQLLAACTARATRAAGEPDTEPF